MCFRRGTAFRPPRHLKFREYELCLNLRMAERAHFKARRLRYQKALAYGGAAQPKIQKVTQLTRRH